MRRPTGKLRSTHHATILRRPVPTEKPGPLVHLSTGTRGVLAAALAIRHHDVRIRHVRFRCPHDRSLDHRFGDLGIAPATAAPVSLCHERALPLDSGRAIHMVSVAVVLDPQMRNLGLCRGRWRIAAAGYRRRRPDNSAGTDDCGLVRSTSRYALTPPLVRHGPPPSRWDIARGYADRRSATADLSCVWTGDLGMSAMPRFLWRPWLLPRFHRGCIDSAARGVTSMASIDGLLWWSNPLALTRHTIPRT